MRSKMQLTIRSTKDSVREHLLKGIERVANAAAEGARSAEANHHREPCRVSRQR